MANFLFMGFLVQKYGGSSVATSEKIKKVAKKIAQKVQLGEHLIVVVSAMGDTTDDLIHLAHQVSNAPSPREMDMLVSSGERISMALLAIALEDLGIQAMSFTGSQTGIITDKSHQRAQIQKILGYRIQKAFEAGKKVAIVAGFQGVSESLEITTLGRGGSDTTAVALAVFFKASECEIYTDVSGVYSSDPRKIPRAKLYPTLASSLMLEMAYRGAGVLHPRSVELAHAHQLIICVRNSFENSLGTKIMPFQLVQNASVVNPLTASAVTASSSEGMENYEICSILADDSQIYFEMVFDSKQSKLAFLKHLADQKIPLLLPQSFSEQKLSGFMEPAQIRTIQAQMDQWIGLKSFKGFESIIPVSVIGTRFCQDSLALLELEAHLEQAHCVTQFAWVSPLAVTWGMQKEHSQKAVEVLHAAYLERNS